MGSQAPHFPLPYFLFFNGFLTPRDTRYTEAPRIAPSAKLASGVPNAANTIGIMSTSFLLVTGRIPNQASA